MTQNDLDNMRAEGLENVPDEVPEYIAIPAKYNELGALTADVKSGDNEIDFPLTSD